MQREQKENRTKGEKDIEDKVIRPFYIQKADTLYAAVGDDDDIHVGLRRGGRHLRIKLCRQNALCGDKPDNAVSDDTGCGGIYDRHRRYGAGRTDVWYG